MTFCLNMQMNWLKYMLSACLLFALSDCQHNYTDDAVVENSEEQDFLADHAFFFAQEEKYRIVQYVKRSPLAFAQTGTGLYRAVIKTGKGNNIQKGDWVTLHYKVYGLDGSLYYQSTDKPFSLLVEKQEAETGLHQGLMGLQEQSLAVLILPSHLAHGLMGDLEKIPARMPICWEIEILYVQSSNY